jgi:hypothetical protein
MKIIYSYTENNVFLVNLKEGIMSGMSTVSKAALGLNGISGAIRSALDVSKSVSSIYRKGWNVNRGLKLISRGAGLAANTAMMTAPAFRPLGAARMNAITIGLFGGQPLIDVANKVVKFLSKRNNQRVFPENEASPDTQIPENHDTREQTTTAETNVPRCKKILRGIASALGGITPLTTMALVKAGKGSQCAKTIDSISTNISYGVDALGVLNGAPDLYRSIKKAECFDATENTFDILGNIAAPIFRCQESDIGDNMSYATGNLVNLIKRGIRKIRG